jgi:ubiquinone/menaquinone biosynthesis C-methylase UbiE
LLASPLRRFLYSPKDILKPHIRKGINVLDVGCGMGFFSLPMARLVGETGKVVCVDLQERMINGLLRRAKKTGLSDRIDARVSQKSSLMLNDIAGKIDFVLAFAIVHEVPDKKRLLSEIWSTMKESGKLLIAEPNTHVSKTDFDRTISISQRAGFEVMNDVAIRRSYAMLLGKKGSNLALLHLDFSGRRKNHVPLGDIL